MNLIQILRRVRQKVTNDKALSDQDNQLRILKKLYSENGLELHLTCVACPEQYNIFKGGKQVAYYRLRNGAFRVDYPECGGETIYEGEPNGDGIFDNDERLNYMTTAMRVVLDKQTKTKADEKI